MCLRLAITISRQVRVPVLMSLGSPLRKVLEPRDKTGIDLKAGIGAA